jgi:hypothetical protein
MKHIKLFEESKNDLIIRALEKGLFNDEEVQNFYNGEDVLVKTTFFPKKEITGKIIKKTSTTYTVMFKDNMKTIKTFSTKTLQSTKEKEGFKYTLNKI